MKQAEPELFSAVRKKEKLAISLRKRIDLRKKGFIKKLLYSSCNADWILNSLLLWKFVQLFLLFYLPAKYFFF